MATTKKNDFKKIKDLSNIVDPKNGKTRVVTLWEYKGRKFRFVFENTNGTPCGFEHMADKYDTTKDFVYGNIVACGEWLIKDMNNFVRSLI